ncbi:CBS domain-containing protein [Mycobacterium adipatum]|uniref:CBS domain-containing protein n=1 Tax=Mycobacterium adipatum TaxID=1682113 RepID=A0A172UN12_9MYCO|nr:CBS domain-containing protein [Mycobacterium adipatum]ANE80393.1 CBS domain-containing protein [Mycobacterium adipatum]
MTTARDIMHTPVTCIRADQTLASAARHMAESGVGALPICGLDDRLQGMVTDRDIIVKCVAVGRDPFGMLAAEVAQGITYHVDAEASVETMLTLMASHQIRRLPVVDKERLVGIVSGSDIARHLPEHAHAQFVTAIGGQQAIPSR